MSKPPTVTVGITSIGSGVGQSVVDSCRLSGLPLKLVGLGCNTLAFGGFDCDFRAEVPGIHDSAYVESLLKQCVKHGIEILIPGLDDELLALARNRALFMAENIDVIVSGEPLLNLCRDKERMSRELSALSTAFVESLDHNRIIELARSEKLQYPLIAKPRAGFASRGISVIRGPEDLQGISGDQIFQTIAIPEVNDPHRAAFLDSLDSGNLLQVAEVSVQLVIGRDGKELGRVATYNKLANGIPIEIIPANVPEIWAVIDQLLPIFLNLGLRGPLNLQGRITDQGPKFFEMNARFTGISGLRAMDGFNEVEAVILDALGRYPNSSGLTYNPRRIGMRQVTSRMVDIGLDASLEQSVAGIQRRAFNVGRTVLVTGANGYLGRTVIDHLLAADGICKVIALVRDASRFTVHHAPSLPEAVTIHDLADLWNGSLNLGIVDVLVHLASGRPIHDGETLSDSLRFTRDLMAMAARHHLPGIIHASSQSIYGRFRPPLWREDMVPLPETPYAQAKWASELMAALPETINHTSVTTSIRLSQLIGPGNGMRFNEVPHLFMKKALTGDPITVQGGRQMLDYLDVRDAARLVAELCVRPFAGWPAVVNAGSGKPVSLADLAKMVNEIACDVFNKGTTIEVVPAGVEFKLGMDIDKVRQVLGWSPKISLAETLRDIGMFLTATDSPARI